MKVVSTPAIRLAITVCAALFWGRSIQLLSQAPAPADSCELIPGKGTSTTAIASVGLTEPVSPTHAPRPANESERLLFRQLYETLIRADCQGRATPGLAASWRLKNSGPDGNTWIVNLRPDARFSDSTPLTAADVASSWMTGAGELRPEVLRLVQSIVVADDRTLEIALQSRRTDAILALAHTDLAVSKTVPGSQWPLGSRPARIDTTEQSSASVITLIRPDATAVRFLVAPGRDTRDVLDQGVDLLLTRDPRTLEYAATLPQFQTAALPWQRTHVLITPSRVRTTPSVSAEDRKALARDAVRGEARGAESPFWWESVSDCDSAASSAPAQLPNGSPPILGRVVYDADDSAARDLAERFVGIGAYPRAGGLAADTLVQALKLGNESGYIVSLDRRPLDPCREVQTLLNNARWIDLASIVPLVDTRLQVIVRRGRSSLISEWDGGLLLGENGK